MGALNLTSLERGFLDLEGRVGNIGDRAQDIPIKCAWKELEPGQETGEYLGDQTGQGSKIGFASPVRLVR